MNKKFLTDKLSNYLLREATRNKQILYMLGSVFTGRNLNNLKSNIGFQKVFSADGKKLEVFGIKFSIKKKKGLVLSFGDSNLSPLAYSLTDKKMCSTANDLFDAYDKAQTFDACYSIFLTLLTEKNIEITERYIISAFEQENISKVMAFWTMMDNEMELLKGNRK